MAALHLLPRELLTIIGSSSSGGSSSSIPSCSSAFFNFGQAGLNYLCFAAGYPGSRHHRRPRRTRHAPSSCFALEAVVCHRLARFRSDFARARKLDPNTVRGFDEPQEGYSHPRLSTPSSSLSHRRTGNKNGVVSPDDEEFLESNPSMFMEEITDEYVRVQQPSFMPPRGGGGGELESKELHERAPSPMTAAFQDYHRATRHANVVNGQHHQASDFVSTMGKIMAAMSKRDLQEALTHLGQSEPFQDSRRSRMQVMQEISPVVRLQRFILANHPTDLKLLKDFALLVASLNMAPLVGYNIFSHLAKFSDPKTLAPAWDEYVVLASRAATSSGPVWQQLLQRTLSRTANAIIRQLCLSGRFQEAIDFLKQARGDDADDELLARSPVTTQSPLRSADRHSVVEIMRDPPVIEVFTYKVLLEELLAATESSASYLQVAEMHRLASRDWPIPEALRTAWTQEEKEQRDPLGFDLQLRYLGLLLQAHHNLRQKVPTRDRRVRGSPRSSVGDAPVNSVQSPRQAVPASTGGTEQLADPSQGMSQDQQMLSNLERLRSLTLQEDPLTSSSDGTHNSSTRLMDMRTRHIEKTLKEMMGFGELPTAEQVKELIDACHASGDLGRAKDFGEWMEAQGNRHRSLWLTARMHRLVATGSNLPDAAAARAGKQALSIFTDNFVMLGVPEQLVALQAYQEPAPSSARSASHQEQPTSSSSAARESGSTAPKKPTPGTDGRLWASSHTIGVAIRAWFLVNPSVENVLETYRSFLANSYRQPFEEHSIHNVSSGSVDVIRRSSAVLPEKMLPDQIGFSHFLTPLVKANAAERALSILFDMADKGIRPNLYNWNIVLGGLAQEGKVQLVHRILERMEASSSSSSRAVTGEVRSREEEVRRYASYLVSLTSSSSSSQASTPPPPPATFTEDESSVECGYDAHSAFDEADAIEYMDLPAPNIVTYTTVLRGFGLAKRLEAAQEVRERLMSSRDEQGQLLYRPGEDPKTEKALEILASMQKLVELGHAKEEARRR